MFAGLPPGIAKWDLLVAVWEYEGRAELPAVLEYSVDLFDEPEIALLADCFLTLLEAVAAHPERRVSGLPLVGGALRRDLLAAPAAPPAPATDLPTALARTDGEAVRHLARRLREAGVRPGDTVAGLLPSTDAATALLAAASVGAVYAPCATDASFAVAGPFAGAHRRGPAPRGPGRRDAAAVAGAGPAPRRRPAAARGGNR
ncbi:hypothetical protein RB200_34160 [Streptomyces sp. PmtG]